jgi:hypothetical protein
VADTYDIAVDFMDLTNDLRLWARAADLRPGFEPSVGRHAVVGDESAEPKVARIVAIDGDGNLELQVLPGSVESHRDLLAGSDPQPEGHPAGPAPREAAPTWTSDT